MRPPVRGALALCALTLTVACGEATDPGGGATCPAGPPIVLAVAAYTIVDATSNAGCIVLPANLSASDSAEYLLVPQSATGVPGVENPFTLHGDVATSLGPVASAPAHKAPTPAERLHDFLRTTEVRRSYGTRTQHAWTTPRLNGPPVAGSQRAFSVCATVDCSRFDQVVATAMSVQGHIAVYVDTTAPSPGLAAGALDSIADLFNQRLYALDTTAFGRESDVDSNTVVIVLLTPTVNRMVSEVDCATLGSVGGFFYGADLDPANAGDARFNHGEVFYALVPDEAGALSCPHSAADVRRIIPVIFVHEFQHMISFNQHVLVAGGGTEAAWLNEGLSHFAEELAARSFLPDDPASYSRYVIGDLSNAYDYLRATGDHYLVASSSFGTLPDRGAAWLFVRYLADQFRADTSFAATAAFTRTLETAPLSGAANVTMRTGVAFDTLVVRWAIANWVSDLPGYAAAPELRYWSWSFRGIFASLNAQNPARYPTPYPLRPPGGPGDALAVTGTLRAGSGVYQRVLQAPQARGIRLLFGDGAGAPLPGLVVPRLSVVRIR